MCDAFVISEDDVLEFTETVFFENNLISHCPIFFTVNLSHWAMLLALEINPSSGWPARMWPRQKPFVTCGSLLQVCSLSRGSLY